MGRGRIHLLRRCLIAAMALYLLVLAAFSLSWRLFHDSAILSYLAFLVEDQGCALYRDAFDTAMPGSVLVHMLIGKTVGYGDLAFRCVDLLWLSGLLAVTWFLLKRLGRIVAGAGALGFGLVYLHHGPIMSFQRDCLALLPVAAALLVAARPGRGAVLRSVVIGGLFGAAAMVKPQFAIGLPVVVGYLIAESRSGGGGAPPRMAASLLRALPAAGIGFLAVLAAPVLWLAHTGGLAAFWEMLSSFLPLYVQMDIEHEVLPAGARWEYLLTEFLRGIQFWLVPVLLGLYVALKRARLQPAQSRLVKTLALLALGYALCPVLAGQFWSYHWMPFRYFALLCFALCLLPAAKGAAGKGRAELGFALIFSAFIALAGRPSEEVLSQVRGQSPDSPRLARVDAIAAFLDRAGLESGETVQPLEWTNSAVHGMLRAKAPLATRYLFTYQFHLLESHPVIIEMRRGFMEELSANPPRFMIEVDGAPRPSGPDCDGPFPELEAFIESRYRIALEENGVRIYERKPG